MKQYLHYWLELAGLGNSELAYLVAVCALILVISLLIHFVFHRVVLRLVRERSHTSKKRWKKTLFGHALFTRIALAVQGAIVYAQARFWLDSEAPALPLIEALAHLWVTLFTLLSVFSLLDALEEISRDTRMYSRLPLRGIAQSLKLVATTIALILVVSLLIGKSPLILLSGLGAMTAVLLLVFRDPILGLVAGIQLSANRMLAVDDWLEMPKYGADGDVIDISLTTVKVRNWDQTITSIPSYALISDSFKNWRNIEHAGGRRIKRAINIDAATVRFLSDDDLARLRRAELLTDYIENKLTEIEKDNREKGVDKASPINGRKLTNLGILRAYLNAYLGASKHINKNLTFMVRQLPSGSAGIPLEIYGFANQTRWVHYENIQSDIFDHVFAIIPEFGLRLYQSPSGHDIHGLADGLQRAPEGMS